MAVSTEMRKAKYSEDDFQQIVESRRRVRMDQIDKLPSDIRECVHEYGWNVVNAHLQIGVKQAKHIRHLVETTLNEFSPTRGATSNQGQHRAPGIIAKAEP